MGSKNKYYAVIRGYQPGIYTAWYGPGGAEEQVRGYAGAVFKGFVTVEEARRWLGSPAAKTWKASDGAHAAAEPAAPSALPGPIIIYTDGGCARNPGPGGYGAVIIDGAGRRELAQGFRRTTNNRMELMACIAALDTLEAPADVILHSDSRYVVNGIGKGWARKWRANGWMRTESDAAENADLWAELLDRCDRRRVRFVWVHGHAGNRENERCDRLATGAAQGPNLKEDHAYVRGRTRVPEI
ncbi:MAG: ribonuclease HI [Syntrophobacterales bacterium CG03_land_8_20_14_0_80_58_14]|nr:MAG: ribonuclease HI [Syntrophaceae bacterium CG2_30_58_14]PIU99988.1 MAG: ribonuclease HI [Syntrophobacterales bacterium CG03_land_8_20_14_0_80_58_14]